MKTLVKIIYVFLIIGVILVVSGVAAGATLDDVKEVLTDQAIYVAYDETIDETFESIYIKSDSKNVEVSVSDMIDKPQLIYHLKSTETMSVGVADNGQLNIELKHQQHFFNWFSFSWPSNDVQTLQVILPRTYQGKLHIQTSAGNVIVKGIFDETILKTQAGNIQLEGSYNSLDVEVSAGNVNISNVAVLGTLMVEGQAGNINVDRSQVSGALNLSLSAGEIDINDVDALSYTLKTSTGNIKLDLNLNKSAYALKLSTSLGNVKIDGSNVSNDYESGTGILVDASTSLGNINIYTN